MQLGFLQPERERHMVFEWNEETIRWYWEANEYTKFYSNIAKIVAPMLEGYRTFCDMGCGLGLINLELSDYVESIDCVDVSGEALSFIQTISQSRGIGNIKTHKADCHAFEGRWDVIHICFFSSGNIEPFLPRCKKLIIIVGGDGSESFYPEKYRKKRKNTISKEAAYLDSLGVEYRLTEVCLEFGQPLKTMEEARRFVRTYAAEITDGELEEFLASNLRIINHEAFSFYLPRMKKIGIFEVKGLL